MYLLFSACPVSVPSRSDDFNRVGQFIALLMLLLGQPIPLWLAARTRGLKNILGEGRIYLLAQNASLRA